MNSTSHRDTGQEDKGLIANVPILRVVIGSTLIDAVVASLVLVVVQPRDKTDRPVIDLRRFAALPLPRCGADRQRDTPGDGRPA